MHCQEATAEAIQARGGGHLLFAKGDQKTLLEDFRLLVDEPEAATDDVAATDDGDHGRIETRRATIVDDVARLAVRHGCPGLAGAGKSKATSVIDDKATAACQSCVSFTAACRRAHSRRRPRPSARREPPPLGSRHGHGRGQATRPQTRPPATLAGLRRFAPDIIRTSEDNGSTRGRIKRAAWDDACQLRHLAAG